MESLKSLILCESNDDDLWELLKTICKRRGVNLKLLSSSLLDMESDNDDIEKITRYYTEYDHRGNRHDVCTWNYWLSQTAVHKILMSSDLKYINNKNIDWTYKILKHIFSVTFGRKNDDSDLVTFDAPFIWKYEDGEHKNEEYIIEENGSMDGEPNIYEELFFSDLNCRTVQNIIIIIRYKTEDRFSLGAEYDTLTLEDILFKKEHYQTFCKEWNYNPEGEKIISHKEHYESMCKKENERIRMKKL